MPGLALTGVGECGRAKGGTVIRYGPEGSPVGSCTYGPGFDSLEAHQPKYIAGGEPVKYIESGYKGDAEELIVVAIGDLHIGSSHFCMDTLNNILKFVDEHRERCRIILMGDIAETATKTSVGAGVYEQTMTPVEQINRAVEIFDPYRDLIDGVVIGNHEMRIYKDSGVDLLDEVFCPKLGLSERYLRYQGVIKYAWNKRAYNFAVWHGRGGGRKAGGALNKVDDMRQIVFGDVFLMGHHHRLAATKNDFYVPDPQNMRMKRITQTVVVTGSSLDYEGSYAEEAGLTPTTKGFPIIRLDGRTIRKKGTTYRVKDVRVEY